MLYFSDWGIEHDKERMWLHKPLSIIFLELDVTHFLMQSRRIVECGME